MPNGQNLKEAEKIKIALYKKIFGELKQDYIAVPEVSLQRNIIDLLVCNGDIHIFEIKSKSDSLKRLEKQIETFSQYANRVTIVADTKFIDKLTTSVYMKDIGITEIKDGKLFTIREAKSKNIDYVKYLLYLNTKEIKEALRGIPNVSKLSTIEAEDKIAHMLKPDEVRRLILYYIKQKYIQEFLRRKEYILNNDYQNALKTRYENILPSVITPLKQVPIQVFRDFK